MTAIEWRGESWMEVNWFPQAAIIKTRDWMSQTTDVYFLVVLEARSWRCWQSFWQGFSFDFKIVFFWPCPYVVSPLCVQREAPLLMWTLVLSNEDPTLMTHLTLTTSLKGFSPSIVTLGVRESTYELAGRL